MVSFAACRFSFGFFSSFNFFFFFILRFFVKCFGFRSANRHQFIHAFIVGIIRFLCLSMTLMMAGDDDDDDNSQTKRKIWKKKPETFFVQQLFGNFLLVDFDRNTHSSVAEYHPSANIIRTEAKTPIGKCVLKICVQQSVGSFCRSTSMIMTCFDRCRTKPRSNRTTHRRNYQSHLIASDQLECFAKRPFEAIKSNCVIDGLDRFERTVWRGEHLTDRFADALANRRLR